MLSRNFVLAHRGISSEYPENTMVAFKEAYYAGMDGIELDVQMTKDKELVVIHDEKLERTTNGKGYVKDHTLKELKSLEAGSFKGEKFKGEKIPTLEEVFKFYSGKEKIVNVELKTTEFSYEGIEKKVLELIKKYNLEENVLVTSFNHLSIERFRELESNIKYGILLEEIQPNILKYIEDYNFNMINPSIESIKSKKELYLEMIKKGKTITSYTIDDLETIKMLKKNKINIITNKRIKFQEI